MGSTAYCNNGLFNVHVQRLADPTGRPEGCPYPVADRVGAPPGYCTKSATECSAVTLHTDQAIAPLQVPYSMRRQTS